MIIMGESSNPSTHLSAEQWAQLIHPAAHSSKSHVAAPGEFDDGDVVPEAVEGTLTVVARSLWKSASGMSRWGMADLTLGLYKLAGRHAVEGAADTINGCFVTSLEELREIYHWSDWALAAYSKDLQTLVNHLQVKEQKIIKHVPISEILKPAYYIAVDDTRECVVMSIRGTMSTTDILTDLNPHSEPFVGGHAHSGMLTSAHSFMDSEASTLRDILKAHEGYKLVLVGHSLGAGTASLLCMLLRDSFDSDQHPLLTLGIPASKIVCWGYGCPPCVDKKLAEHAVFINNVILQDDVIARVCPAALEDLRSEILETDWSQVFENGSRIKTVIDLAKSTYATVKQVEPALGVESGFFYNQAKKYGYAALVATKHGIATSLEKAQRGEHGANAQTAASWFSFGATATETVLSVASRGLSGFTNFQSSNTSPKYIRAVETDEDTRGALEMRRLVVPGVLYHVIKKPLDHGEEIKSELPSVQMDLAALPVNEANTCSSTSIDDSITQGSEKNLLIPGDAEALGLAKVEEGETSKAKPELRHRCIVIRGDDPASRFKRIILSSSLLSDHMLLSYRDCLLNAIGWASSDVSDL